MQSGTPDTRLQVHDPLLAHLTAENAPLQTTDIDKLVSIVESNGDFIATASMQHQLTYLNSAGRRLVGIGEHDDIRQYSLLDFASEFSKVWLREEILVAVHREGHWAGELTLQSLQGKEPLPMEGRVFVHGYPNVGETAVIFVVLRDASNRKRLEDLQVLALMTLNILNRHESTIRADIEDILMAISMSTGMQFVGVRTTPDNYLPSESIGGISSSDWIRAEGLSICQQAIECWPGETAELVDCLCGYVLNGQATASAPNFTEAGSFWTNELTKAVTSGLKLLPTLRMNGYCQREGIESLALIPLRAENQIIGVLQLGHKERGRLSPDLIQFFEGLGNSIGIALARRGVTRQLTEAKQRAEAANRVKSEFLANMSHELRTPLNAIVGFTDLTLETSIDEQQRNFLHIVKRGADDLVTLIDDILDLARIEANYLELDHQEFDIRGALNRAAQSLGLRARAKELTLECHVADSVPTRIVGDELRLRQVVLNLLNNAIKFTKSGGVRVNVARQEVQVTGVETCVLRFAVSDTGVGIPKEKLEMIFDPFSQVDSSLSRAYGGVGLGLAISKRLVESMNGRIWVESALGTGSTFFFTVSVGLASDSAVDLVDRSAASVRRVNRGLRILVADDDDRSRMLTTVILERDGHDVVVVENGEAAVTMAREQNFDLVLMDVQMPVMNGLDAARNIRGLSAQSDSGTVTRASVPIVALTAHAMKGDAEKCLGAGMNDYLTKPLDAAKLRTIVKKLMRR